MKEQMVNEQIWTDVDHYLDRLHVAQDDALKEALKASEHAGLPSIQVSPAQGKFLHLLARMVGAKRILEIGTLGGYSTIWMARALSRDGRLISLEIDPRHAQVARANIERAQLAGQVEIRLGPALESLAQLSALQAGPFDLSFIDADKANIPAYFDFALKLSRPGSLIVVDNVIRRGAVIDANSDDPNVLGVRRLNERLAVETRVSATTLQTVGAKGYDGLTLALVTG